MALLPILTAPDPRLKKKSKPVETVDADVRRLMDEMLETMYAAPGIGLAAPQVGVLKRVIVLDIDREDVKTGPLLMANPEMLLPAEQRKASGARPLEAGGSVAVHLEHLPVDDIDNQAARGLGISRRALYRLIAKYKLE